MLTMFRKMLRSKIGPVLFGIVIVGMAVWGIDDIFSGGGNSLVTAGNRSVSVVEFDETVKDRLSDLSRQQLRAVTISEAVESGIVDQLFQQELSSVIVLGYGEQIGGRASTDAVMKEVFKEDAFNNAITGEFDATVYRDALRRINETPRRFEQGLRDNLTRTYISGAAGAAVEPPEAYTKLISQYEGERRSVSFIRIDGSDISEIPDPSDEDLQTYFEENKTNFGQPERRGITVLHFSPEDFRQSVEITDEMLQDAYEFGKAQKYSTPQTRRYLEATFATEAAALQAVGALAAGADPQTLESLISIDEKTATRSDIADSSYGESLFGLAEGAVAGPASIGGTWVIARVEEIILGEPFPFEEVEDQVRSALIEENAQLAFEEAARGIEDLKGEGLDLKEIGERIGAPALSFVPVDQRGATQSNALVLSLISLYPDVLREAADKFEGEFTERYDLDDGGIYLGQLDTIVPPAAAEFDDVRDRVLAQWKITNSGEAVTLFAENLARKINRGETTLEAEANSLGKVIERPGAVLTRSNPGNEIPRAAALSVFGVKSEGGAVASPSDNRREHLLISVDSIQAPDASAVDAMRASVRQRLTGTLDNDLIIALGTEIEAAVDMNINERAFAAYKAQNARQ